MKTFAKSALVLGAVGAIALGSVTASEARSGRWVAGAAGFAVGAAAANAAYYNGGYYYGPDYAYDTGYDAYAYSPGSYTGYDSYAYAPGYAAYAYAPGYPYRRSYRGRRHIETQSVPHHYDPGGGYNSNTIAPWQDWKYQGNDY